MKFTLPLLFVLLLFIPYFVWLGRPQTNSGKWREWTSLALRLLIIILLILGLAGAQLVRAADDLAVIFLIDASDSVRQEQLEDAEMFVREAIEQMGPDDQAAVIVFGADALVDRPMSGLAELAPITSIPQPLHTDIAKAIRLGLALFPPGSARRILLLSDGLSTTGDAAKAAQLAADSGVQINVLPLTRPSSASASRRKKSQAQPDSLGNIGVQWLRNGGDWGQFRQTAHRPIDEGISSKYDDRGLVIRTHLLNGLADKHFGILKLFLANGIRGVDKKNHRQIISRSYQLGPGQP